MKSFYVERECECSNYVCHPGDDYGDGECVECEHPAHAGRECGFTVAYDNEPPDMSGPGNPTGEGR